jgi:hypothetical protein
VSGGDVAQRLRGPLLFARYAHPPNALGYCGPSDTGALSEPAQAGDLEELRHLAGQFDGAWPYLELIAGCNGLPDPLDPRVVEAYWVGNELLRNVSTAELSRSLNDRFARRAGRRFGPLVAAAPGGTPHHSFHVFAVYPWLGLLRAGMEGAPMTVLERCRIRWGRVLSVSGDMAVVRTQRLCFDGARLALGPEDAEPVRLAADSIDFGLGRGLEQGDVVSLHWDWVCDHLSPTSLGWLKACTRRNLDAVNGLAAPGPAVVCDV